MPPVSTLPLVDRILDGRLAELLTRWRGEGLSYEAISRRMAVEHDLEIGADTIRAWARQLNVEPASEQAS